MKKDPVKSAVYNPREFRKSHVAAVMPKRRKLIVWAISFGSVLVSLWYHFGPAGSTYASDVLGNSSSMFALPPNGTVVYLKNDLPGSSRAPFQLLGDRDGSHCLLRIDEWQTNSPVLSIFVRSGEVADASIPIGQYRGKIFCGTAWFGTKWFGQHSAGVEVITPLVFTRTSNGTLQGKTIDLTRRVGGNLPTRPTY